MPLHMSDAAFAALQFVFAFLRDVVLDFVFSNFTSWSIDAHSRLMCHVTRLAFFQDCIFKENLQFLWAVRMPVIATGAQELSGDFPITRWFFTAASLPADWGRVCFFASDAMNLPHSFSFITIGVEVVVRIQKMSSATFALVSGFGCCKRISFFGEERCNFCDE